MPERFALVTLAFQAVRSAVESGAGRHEVRHYLDIATAAVRALDNAEAGEYEVQLQTLAQATGETVAPRATSTSPRACLASLQTSTPLMQVDHVVRNIGAGLDVTVAREGVYLVWSTPLLDAHPFRSAVALYTELDAYLRQAFDEDQIDQFLLTPQLG